MTRDSFVFYRSFAEAIRCLPDAERVKVYDAICDYALEGKETEEGGVVSAMLCLVKPQIDANNKRYTNGKKGGRPTDQTEAEANQEQTKSKPRTNQERTTSEPNVNVNVNENVNANENVNVNVNAFKDSCSEPSSLADCEAIPLNDGTEWRPTTEEFAEYVRLYPSVDIKQQFASMRGWSLGNPTRKKTAGGVKRFVTSWLSKEQDRSRAAPKPVKTNSFNDFEQRTYDYDALEKKLLAK